MNKVQTRKQTLVMDDFMLKNLIKMNNSSGIFPAANVNKKTISFTNE